MDLDGSDEKQTHDAMAGQALLRQRHTEMSLNTGCDSKRSYLFGETERYFVKRCVDIELVYPVPLSPFN